VALPAPDFLNGMETIRKFIDFCGPGGLCGDVRAGDLDPVEDRHCRACRCSSARRRSEGSTIGHMANAAMLIVAYFAALLLNFGDFSRFAKDERR
jgi:NCS1 family nucleobase:cation symporter-1